MSDVTRILSAIEQGDPKAAEQLLPLVYDELRKLAAQRLAQEKPGQTLQATALVHEAYLRLVDGRGPAGLGRPGPLLRRRGRGDAADPRSTAPAASSARSTGATGIAWTSTTRGTRSLRRSTDLLALDEALDKLAAEDPRSAELVKLRYFAGLSIDEAAEALGISPRTADRRWAYARAWLRQEMLGE